METNQLNQELQDFPYTGYLDLSNLLNYWKANLSTNNIFSGYPADHILNEIDESPELWKPIKDLKVLNKHKELLGLLMSAVFPPAFVETDLAAALIPYELKGFYATPGYREIFPVTNGRADLKVNVPDGNFKTGKIVNAGIQILNKFYDANIEIEKPILITVPDKEFKDLERVYKIDMNMQFVDVINTGKLPEVTKADIRRLLDNIYDSALWLKTLPPKNFEFRGFAIVRLVDVTVEEMLSSIKYDLLKKDTVTCSEGFESIQRKIRSIFKLPQLKMGLSYFDPQNNIISNYGSRDWSSFLITDEFEDNISCDCFMGSIYERAHMHKKPVIIEDLEDYTNKTDIEKQLLKEGIKNIAIAPLIYENEVIGILELGTPYPGKLNPVNAAQLENVMPMFTAAVRRVLDEMQVEVRAVIQEQCTAIHPSVEWKFMEEGYNLISERRNGRKGKLGNIVFDNVYPIYGMSDIRNSSGERNAAIQRDLEKNLQEVQHVLQAILEYKKMPILDEINQRVDEQLANIEGGLESGDESAVIDFLKNEIVPLFKHFRESDETLRPILEEYEKQLEPGLGVIYEERKDFETSLTRINDTISNYLDRVEEQAQEIFPHYFEKYKTDGVEYNIYIGESLVQNKQFNPIYLRNMRLWQLITMCEIAVSVDQLKNELPKKLEITQLILVHGDPLSIRFRQDEKHFDVDGAYNIRYEIVKKRIDKAYIKNTRERLTQPGKISIVYTQTREANEYDRYIRYLQSVGYLTEAVEHFELEELQGAQGLRAIRVEVNHEAQARDFGNKVLNEVIEAIEA